MTREEREITIDYLEGMKEEYVEGEGYERHPLNEWFALDYAIKALEQECILGILDKIIAEIEEIETYDGLYVDRAYVLEIIDKYKVKSEDK